MRILFSGALNTQSSTGWQRCDTLKRLGNDVYEFDDSGYRTRAERRILRRLDGRGFVKAEVERFNRDLLRMIVNYDAEIIWIEKGLMLQRETLSRIARLRPKSMKISYQDDNPFGGREYEVPLWKEFIGNIPYYDLHFVKRDSDIIEFVKRGARAAKLFMTGYYSPLFEKLPEPNPNGSCWDVSFMGTLIDDRGSIVDELMLRRGLNLHVFGRRWNRCAAYYLKSNRFHGPYGFEATPRIIAESKVNLGFVSSSNRDEYAGRSLEIPAAGGFLLAERTVAHRALYREGVEAEFYSDVNELVDKCRFYIENIEARTAIAIAGRERTKHSDYSLTRSLTNALIVVSEQQARLRSL